MLHLYRFMVNLDMVGNEMYEYLKEYFEKDPPKHYHLIQEKIRAQFQ